MFVDNRLTFLGLVFILSCSAALKQYGTPGKTLYVAEDPDTASGKLTVIERTDAEASPSVERRKRQAATLNSPVVQKNISTWTTHLNDSHQQLMVHWVGEGSNVIICLARDSSPRNKGGVSPSALFISYDYGKNFTNKTESFRLGDTPDSGYAQLDKFFNHPKFPEFCVFVDSTNKMLFYTNNNGQTIHRSSLAFHPSELAFDEEFPDKYVILDKVDTNRKLYLTLDGGKTFKMIQSFVKTFFWSSGPGFPKVFYVERWKPDGTSTVFSAKSPTELVNADVLFEEAKDFQIKGDYMFATKQSKERNTLHLYISHKRGLFYKAEFETELDLRKFHIADVTDQRIFVSVMHTDALANLYVSEINQKYTQYNFVLSMEQILCYFPDGNWKDSWLEDVTEDPFTDLYRVEGLKGIYIASRVDSKAPTASIGPEHLISLITYDHGVTWSPVKPPSEDENGKPLNCHIENSCSLHLCQKFSQLYPVTRSASIMSSKSAPGIIMATGVMGKSLKGIPGVYLSRDAGLTWKRILKDYYFFNYGDHGGVLVAVKYFKSRGETRRILYSTNEGIDWNSYQFNADDLRIYGLMTEPGENTTTFTMFGSANEQHQWIIITIDLKNTFARNCTDDDYKYWSPSPPNSSVSCVLGSRNIFQRRLAHTNCYHGVNYERAVTTETCECSRRDFQCDYGFMLSGTECIRNKSEKFDVYSVPAYCKPGDYYLRTRGYKKIGGDVCTISGYMAFAPERIPCPIEEPQEFMLVALRDKIARIDLSDNSTIYPVKDQKNIVAIEFDIKNNCIYWADIEMDKISRQCFNANGSAQEIVVDTELASIEGMALDYISNVLFFVDGLRKKIEAVRTDLSSEGRMRVTILDSKILSKPRGITVHPRAGYLFWTDWDRNHPSISRSNLDGTEVNKLFGKPIVQWPNGITIDQMSERIYWVDAMEDYIASADLNGRFFRRILWNDEKVSHPFAVAVLKDNMFWDDWKEKSIFIADKDTGANIITINDSFSGLMDLKVFAHFTQVGSNACSYKNTSCDALCLGGPGNTFSCLCPEGFKRVGNKCLCPNGMEPEANMTCPRKPGGTCDPDQFTCKNGLCLPISWRCDGNNDCGDQSDEIGCMCTPPMISCDNTQCYLPSWKCDGDMDCADMSDEQDCGTQNCTENQFQCANGHCIDKRWLCDGDNDCKDGSDERNCTISSKRPQMNCRDGFSCGNTSGLCVPNSWVCDGEADCPGGEDEQEERCKNSTCAPYMFRCPSGKCIFKTWVCDGENDCSDVESSDEQNCTNIPHSKLLPYPGTERPQFPMNVTCLDSMFKCDNGNCVPEWWRCDAIDDCGDQSDEVGCGLVLPEPKTVKPDHTSIKHKCGKNHFTCSPGTCIPLSWVCDGASDCPDGVDERECRNHGSTTGSSVTCRGDWTPCADGRGCVLQAKLCDGVVDCADRSDEARCGHGVSSGTCRGDWTPCADGRGCVLQAKLCDRVVDCADGSDEARCGHGVSSVTCRGDWTPCADGRGCVLQAKLCDGVVDCADGSDEARCGHGVSSVTCRGDWTPCADGRGCVLQAKLYDGVVDCADGSDEARCGHGNHTTDSVCPSERFSCDDGLVCLPMMAVCDGRQHCYDGTDETNCSSSSNENHMYQFLSLGVDQSSINSSSFLISCWMAQQKMVVYSFLPSISKVSDGKWINMTWTNDSIYRFTNLEPFTNYNVTFYIRDSKSNKTYASNKYVNTTTGEGVPSAPRKLTVRQMIGSRVQVLWDAPEFPRGVIQHYTLYHAPPIPPISMIVPANGNKTLSVAVNSYFRPNVNYSFWVEATNNAYTSKNYEVAYLVFDGAGDVDDIANVSMSRINDTAVYLEWHKIRAVEGYKIELRLPTEYARREPVTTRNNNVTITNLPPGTDLFIDLKAWKGSIYSDPFTIPLKTGGQPDEILHPSLTLLAGRNAVQLNWSPPEGDRYKGKSLVYEVHYSNMIHRTNPGELSNDTRIVTNSTEILIDDLHACEKYVFSVGILGGPLNKTPEILTKPRPTAAVKNLRVEYNEKKSELKVLWDTRCGASLGPVTYRLKITEETRKKTSRYELKPTRATSLEHVLEHVPVGGRYNICVHAAVEDAEVRCIKFRSRTVEPPRGVAAWRAPNGHVMVTWRDDEHDKEPNTKYEVIVSSKEIPEDLVHTTDDMKTLTAQFSPFLLQAPTEGDGPMYVGVRVVTRDGYYSDLSEVHTLEMEGSEAEPVSATSALWWGAGAAIIVGVALGGALLHIALRHRRLTRSFLRFTRYDSRRGQATIAEHDDDDVPPIHGFSDDEPLVIA